MDRFERTLLGGSSALMSATLIYLTRKEISMLPRLVTSDRSLSEEISNMMEYQPNELGVGASGLLYGLILLGFTYHCLTNNRRD
jgi:hypothetical protein